MFSYVIYTYTKLCTGERSLYKAKSWFCDELRLEFVNISVTTVQLNGTREIAFVGATPSKIYDIVYCA